MGEEIKYFHRDLSWLLFNRRVIEKSYDEDYPILEQLKFLAIASNNLDEFFMVRVPAIQSNARLRSEAHKQVAGTGMNHEEILEELNRRNQKNLDLQYLRFQELLEHLKEKKVYFKRYDDLNEVERPLADNYFERIILPALTPIGLDSYHATPKIENQLIHLFLHLQKEGKEDTRVILPLPVQLNRLVALEGTETFINLEEVIQGNFDKIFLGWQLKRYFTFRVTLDQNPDFEEDPDDDIIEQIEDYLIERRRGLPSRIEISIRDGNFDEFKHDLEKFEHELCLKKRDFYFIKGPLDLTILFGFISQVKVQHSEWLFSPFVPNQSDDWSESNIFSTIDSGDILLHHPYDSYQPVLNFLSAAAKSPDTIAIKQTLYRVAEDSRVIEALCAASKAGKQVTAVVELKARFDEENNLKWVKVLEDAGVYVIYGVPDLKTHSKALLVVKKVGEETKSYVHLGTGNYNESTSKMYTDISLLSANPAYGRDLVSFFNFVAGYSELPNYERIVVSPFGISMMIVKKIDEQIERQMTHQDGYIFLKVNALTSKLIIDKLYEASQKGVKIQLIVRGACVLKVGNKEQSETIEVRSIVGRFLEHSRIYAFGSGKHQEIWISSADTMTRNMDNRIEIATRLYDKQVVNQAREIIQAFTKYDKKTFFLHSNELYQTHLIHGELSPQTYFVKEAEKRSVEVQKEVYAAKRVSFFKRLFNRR